MDVTISYDLFEKVNTANGKMNFKRIMLEEFRNGLILYSTYIAADTILRNIFPKNEGVAWTLYLYSTLAAASIRTLGKILIQKKLAKKDLQDKACETLKDLSLVLSKDFNIDTDLESLKKAKINKVKRVKGVPKVLNHKYILIPSNDELQNIGNTCILQEHIPFTKKYSLSLVTPKTK